MLRVIGIVVGCLMALPVMASPLRVAVASNFLLPLEALSVAYAQQGGGELRISSGATGQHYAQIINGAPFDVFLAADAVHPSRLVEAGFAVPGTQQTYALGSLVLWANADADLPSQGFEGLSAHQPRRVAIANPQLAPYGRAARQALEATEQWQALAPRIVEGKNIGQALQFLATGNVSHALIAASFTKADRRPAGQWIAVDPTLHDPIQQDAVILNTAEDLDQAQAFLEFLAGPKAREVLESFGYRWPEGR